MKFFEIDNIIWITLNGQKEDDGVWYGKILKIDFRHKEILILDSYIKPDSYNDSAWHLGPYYKPIKEVERKKEIIQHLFEDKIEI